MNFLISSQYAYEELFDAVFKGRTDRVRELIDSVNVIAVDRNGDTVLHIAVERGYEEIAEIILEFNVDVNSVNKYSNTPIHLAAYYGSKNIVKMLIDRGVDINVKDPNGDTALNIAALYGHDKIAEILLNLNADVNSRDDFNRILIHLAAKVGNENIVKLLADKGADVNIKVQNGRTALHVAAHYGYEKIAEILLEFNADPNSKCEKGLSPLFYAVKEGFEYVVLLLLEYGADVNIMDTNDLIFHNKFKEIIKNRMIKLHVAGLFVSEQNMQSISNSQSYQTECRNEIERLKSKMISDTNVSFYDILIKPPSKVAAFSKDSIILLVVKSDDYRSEFPIYASLLNSKFKIGMGRRKLQEKLDQLLKIFYNFSKLKPEFYEKIYDYLKYEELRNLIDACKSTSI